MRKNSRCNLFAARRSRWRFNPIDFDLVYCRMLLQYLKEKDVQCLKWREFEAGGQRFDAGPGWPTLVALPGRRLGTANA